ncbi:hypothetical protein TKK_0010024 [Trichogramma kaykai]
MPRDQGAGQSYDDGHGLEEPMVQVERPHNFSTWICCVPCYWLRRSKAVHKALLTFAMLLVTSLLVTSPVLFLITTLPEGDQPRVCSPLDEACIRERDGSEGVCNTQACHEAARRMLATMQRGVDPCKDFYQFACGNFRNRLAYQPTSSFSSLQEHVDEQIENLLLNKTGKMNGVYNKLGHFYNSCLEFKNKPVDFNPVYNLLAKLGGYISPKGTEPTDITPLVSSLLKITGASLFDLYIDIDLFDHNKRAIFLDLPKKYLSNDFINEVPVSQRFSALPVIGLSWYRPSKTTPVWSSILSDYSVRIGDLMTSTDALQHQVAPPFLCAAVFRTEHSRTCSPFTLGSFLVLACVLFTPVLRTYYTTKRCTTHMNCFLESWVGPKLRGLRTLLSRRVSWNLLTPQSPFFRTTTLSCLLSRLELKTQMAQWLFRSEIFKGLLPFGRFVKVSPTAPDSLAALAILLDVSKYQVYFSVLQ